MSQREIYHLNTDWLYIPKDIPAYKEMDCHEQEFEEVTVPHTNIELPHNFFSEKEYQFISWYRRHIICEEEWQGKRIFVDFDGAMSVAEVYINGHFLGENKGGYVPFSFDITDYLHFDGQDNVIALRLDSTHRPDIPPEGDIVDYLLFGGLYRDVYLRVVAPVYIENTFIMTPLVDKERASVKVNTLVHNLTKSGQTVTLRAVIINQETQVVGELVEEKLVTDAMEFNNMELLLEDPLLWNLDTPYLYKAVVSLEVNGRVLDSYTQRFGIRSIAFENGSFFLNGKHIKLRGLNRHQMFPYVGQAMSNRMQEKDAEICKYDLGLNFVRTSHYPQDPSFLDRCDEIGLLVLTEIPGWQHIGDEAWQDVSKEHLVKMIVRDRNHPSIFLWGVRINESPDHHDFYTETNRIAKLVDTTRPTGGIRNFETSEFLEDVYTYNDFQYNLDGKLTLPTHSPTLVTEYMGHMFPTKRFDNDSRLVEHALKHASIQSNSYSMPNLAGACGWCAFDYNTHENFGSGDRICYHGVMDIWRIPKYAAHFYQSQRDSSEGVTLFIARRLVPSMYEDGAAIIPVFSNCDVVELFVNGESIGRKCPDYTRYPSLPHPPFIFHQRLPWPYTPDSEITAVGYINGEVAGRTTLKLEGLPKRISITPDHHELIADGSDMTRLLIQVLDENEQPVSLGQFAIQLAISGEGVLVGENPLVLEAGQAAVYVKTTRINGKMTITAVHPRLGTKEIEITSVPSKLKTVRSK